jgi:hypothetical protein
MICHWKPHHFDLLLHEFRTRRGLYLLGAGASAGAVQILCEPERHDDKILKSRLRAAGSVSPDFIAIIGYRFGKLGEKYDDYVSLEWFTKRFRNFPGEIYVIDLFPDETHYEISHRIKSLNVIGVKAYWNILSHVIILSLNGLCCDRDLYAMPEATLAELGANVRFPP